MQTPSRYVVHVDGTPFAGFKHFGDANHCAFDALPGCNPRLGTCEDQRAQLAPYGLDQVHTEVFNCKGLRLASYLLRRGRLALPVE